MLSLPFNSRGFIFMLFEITAVFVVVVLRFLLATLSLIPLLISLFVWFYIGYNTYVLGVLSWLRENMYAAERVNIYADVD